MPRTLSLIFKVVVVLDRKRAGEVASSTCTRWTGFGMTLYVSEFENMTTNYDDVSVVRRRVLSEDVGGILAEEIGSFKGCSQSVLVRSRAARIAVRKLLREHGCSEWPLLRRLGIGPCWPPGLIGSLSHCDEYAAAALASSGRYSGIGIDIEPAQPLAFDILERVIVPSEKQFALTTPYGGRLLFCAKEATYKAAYSIDRQFLEMHDVEIDLSCNKALTRYGQVANLVAHIDLETITVLALIKA